MLDTRGKFKPLEVHYVRGANLAGLVADRRENWIAIGCIEKLSADHPNRRSAATPRLPPSQSLGRFWTTVFRAVEIHNNGFCATSGP